MTAWIAVGSVAGGALGYLVTETDGLTRAEAASSQDIIARFGPRDHILRIGEGEASKLPCAAVPEGAQSVPALEQANPADVVSAWVRVWVAGVLAMRANWDGIVCATHEDVTHWLHVSANEVVSVQSSLTPRLTKVLGGADAPDADALADTMSRPERLAAHLRQAEVRGDGAAVSGHLLGAELAATKPYWLGQEVVIVSDAPAAHLKALEAQGAMVSVVTPEDATQQGVVFIGHALGWSDL